MNITVYLGARDPDNPALTYAARELGTWIGANNHQLIYGGSHCGLMGELAESTLLAGGRVTGVEPQFFIDAGFEYDEITELIVTKDMSDRKAKMIELGDAFIAFPGGTGTLEEISEVISKSSHFSRGFVPDRIAGSQAGIQMNMRFDKGRKNQPALEVSHFFSLFGRQVSKFLEQAVFHPEIRGGFRILDQSVFEQHFRILSFFPMRSAQILYRPAQCNHIDRITSPSLP